MQEILKNFIENFLLKPKDIRNKQVRKKITIAINLIVLFVIMFAGYSYFQKDRLTAKVNEVEYLMKKEELINKKLENFDIMEDLNVELDENNNIIKKQ